jgi:hypothetical protein
MRLVVPYRPGMLFARTYDAAQAWEGGCEFVRLRNKREPADGRPTYFELLTRLWRSGGGFVMLEQDVVPYEGAIEAIAECPEPWCGYGYSPNGGIADFFLNLGCTKISPAVIAATQEFVERERDWDVCDAFLSECATRSGYRPHRHLPDVPHRGTRHLKTHPLGDDFIEFDENYQPAGPPRTPYRPLQASSRLGSRYMGDGRGFRAPAPADWKDRRSPQRRLIESYLDMVRVDRGDSPVAQPPRDPLAEAIDTAYRRAMGLP